MSGKHFCKNKHAFYQSIFFDLNLRFLQVLLAEMDSTIEVPYKAVCVTLLEFLSISRVVLFNLTLK